MSSLPSSWSPYIISGIIGALLGSSALFFFTKKKDTSASTRRDLLSSSLPTPNPALPSIRPAVQDIDSDDETDLDKFDFSYKMVLCVRQDLKMTHGKIAAQVGHAVLGAYRRAMKGSKDSKAYLNVVGWLKTGQAKIALKCPDEKEMDALVARAKEAGLTYYVVMDAGRTQIAAGSRTVLAIGPAPIAEVDKVTSHLKLY